VVFGRFANQETGCYAEPVSQIVPDVIVWILGFTVTSHFGINFLVIPFFGWKTHGFFT
jgi:hypothetical protein